VNNVYSECGTNSLPRVQVLLALEYLQKQHIAHRDVRSDNLLLNKDGVLKIGLLYHLRLFLRLININIQLLINLADFSNAVQVTPEAPVCTGAAGVIYWQVRCAGRVLLQRLAHFYIIGT